MQARPAYESLAHLGVHRQTRQHTDPEFRVAYQWLVEQMARRLPTDGPEAVWLWARTTWRDLAEDLRLEGRQQDSVLLEVAVPMDAALVLPFDDWHQVLNGMLHVPPLPRETDGAWWARAEPLLDDFHRRVDAALGDKAIHARHDRYPPGLRQELTGSWEHLFDPLTWPAGCRLQAVVHELRAEHVVRALRYP
ncbi:DUF3841 domain-containing protein [Nocardioides litoris]|uniref:DUF3841 domain-containing protein n=1 Tax=Nocardioides litoris TaxID=1926648 RepID=UPI0014777DC8|nr:DUF3841 domain-containing protein [Nocardioides litoris]